MCPSVSACLCIRCRTWYVLFCTQAASLLQVLPPVVRKYRSLLPLKHWRAVCMQTMHVLQATVNQLTEYQGAGPKSSLDRRGVENVSEGGPAPRRQMAWEELGPAMLSMQQFMLCSIHSCLHERTEDPMVRHFQAIADECCVAIKAGIHAGCRHLCNLQSICSFLHDIS